MQITIHEAQIVEAIRNYIMTKLVVRDDQRIDVDLKATRGELGYQAIIDILDKSAPEPETKAQPEAKVEKEKPKAEPKPEAEKAPAKAAEPSKPAATPFKRGTKSQAFSAPAEPAKTQDVPEAASSDEKSEGSGEAASDAPAPARLSIFGGLKNRNDEGSLNGDAEAVA